MITTILYMTLALGPVASPASPIGHVRQAAALDEYSELQKELKEALRAYRVAQREARQAGSEDEFSAPKPITLFFDRFEALAKAGNPDAILFCAIEVENVGRPSEEIRALKATSYERLSTEFVALPLMEQVIVQVIREDRWLNSDLIERTLGRIAKEGKTETARAEASYQLGRRMEAKGSPLGMVNAKSLYASVLEKFPNSRAAKRCSARLEGLKLAVGNQAPDFQAADPDGNEFKLSDYRGKVVVLDFWGFW